MKYFEFLDDIIENFRVSKMIEIVKIEQDLEENELLTVAYEATRSLIIVANYKETPDIDMPQIQGFSQLDFIKQIINLENGSKKSSVKFKKNDDDIAVETNFKIDNTNIKNKNVAKSLLPETPRKLSGFTPDLEVEFDEALIGDILRKLSLSIFNASVYITKNNKDKLSLKLTNDVDVVDIDLPFDVEEGILDEPFKIDLDRLISILKVGSNGVAFAISEKQNLARIVKDNDIAEYQYFLIKKAS
jgi:hypothetical protein